MKRLEEIIVYLSEYIHACVMHLIHLVPFQDSLKVEALVKECEDSASLIPKLEDSIPKLQKLLLDEEKVLDEIKESSKGGALSFFILLILEGVFDQTCFV